MHIHVPVTTVILIAMVVIFAVMMHFSVLAFIGLIVIVSISFAVSMGICGYMVYRMSRPATHVYRPAYSLRPVTYGTIDYPGEPGSSSQRSKLRGSNDDRRSGGSSTAISDTRPIPIVGADDDPERG